MQKIIKRRNKYVVYLKVFRKRLVIFYGQSERASQ